MKKLPTVSVSCAAINKDLLENAMMCLKMGDLVTLSKRFHTRRARSKREQVKRLLGSGMFDFQLVFQPNMSCLLPDEGDRFQREWVSYLKKKSPWTKLIKQKRFPRNLSIHA